MATIRVITVVAIIASVGWAVWLVTASLRENVKAMPEAAKSTPMKPPELRTDGVLDNEWLARALALPKNASLIELDLQKLRTQLMSDDQVVNATLTRNFPDKLIVQITERSPVARVKVDWLGQQSVLLVSHDGVIYAGTGYAKAMLDTLPWLDGVTIAPNGGKFRPIEGMESVAELLGKAQLEADHLYSTWHVVSLARLGLDQRIEVRTDDVMADGKSMPYVAYFSTRDDYFRQLVKLNYICDQLVNQPPGSKATIDLTLGQDVPVMITRPEPDPATEKSSPRSGAGRVRGGPENTPARKDASAMPGPTFNWLRPITARSEQALFVLPSAQPNRTNREL